MADSKMPLSYATDDRRRVQSGEPARPAINKRAGVMQIDNWQLAAAAARYNERDQVRHRNQALIEQKRYLDVDSPERVEKFLKRHGFARAEAEAYLHEGRRTFDAPQQAPEFFERILGLSDLMGVSFLEKGLQVAQTVGRIRIGDDQGRTLGFGTGFLVSPRLLLTNHHVLGDKTVAGFSWVEFNYQVGISGQLAASVLFRFAPDDFHFADRDLDFALVAVQPRSHEGRGLAEFGSNPLIEAEGKAIAAQWINIIQHPNGEPKQLCFRENQVIDILEQFLHYRSDTAPGSSGSPLFNDRWEVIGLHHSGVPRKNAAGQILAIDGQVWRAEMGEHRICWKANEGVRTSRIVAFLKSQSMSSHQQQLFQEIFVERPLEQQPREREAGSSPGQVSAVDGTVTWTIPISVSINVGGAATANSNPPPAADPSRSDLPATTTQTSDPQVPPSGSDDVSVLAAAQKELAREDVLGVRLGWVFENGWITNRRAVVVTVSEKKTPAALRESTVSPLPKSYRGLPVEVRNPTLPQLLEKVRGVATAEAAFEPTLGLTQEILYQPPDDIPAFDADGEQMKVVAHVSPDAGWSQLKEFLAATKKTLTIGMYDFGAPHIVEAVEEIVRQKSFQELDLVMQKGESIGSGTKENDLADVDVVEKLQEAISKPKKFEHAWVKKGSVNGWISSSYHIKVAVRDHEAIWLSSGNWQSSNLPADDPLSESPQRRHWLDNYNRDWHAIIEHPGLAALYEAYLKHDLANNLDTDAREALDLPDLLVPKALFVALERRRKDRKFEYFEPFAEAARQYDVRPLLTPDDDANSYFKATLALVKRAKRQLLIQNQTFKAPKPSHDKLRELVEAVLEKQQSGVEVRIIFRILFAPDAQENLEALKDFGFDTDSIRVQPNCHTKAIIVDRKEVLFGSQNWSNDGVSLNRDASLLFNDAPLAEYFANIFEHDWNNLAEQDVGSDRRPVRFVEAAEATPEGMIRLDWKDYLEMV
jgi:V8-like Glu-specific endopeptidase